MDPVFINITIGCNAVQCFVTSLSVSFVPEHFMDKASLKVAFCPVIFWLGVPAEIVEVDHEDRGHELVVAADLLANRSEWVD
jgi:hypothetical protein